MNRPRHRPLLARCALIAAAVLLGGCDYLGIQSESDKAAAREAEGRAIGSACRHAGRALEDCYAYNPGASKAAVFTGWKSMNDYMAENKIETIKPLVEPKPPGSRRKPPAEAGEDGAKAETAHGDGAARDSAGKDGSGKDSAGKVASTKTATARKIDLPFDAAKGAAPTSH